MEIVLLLWLRRMTLPSSPEALRHCGNKYVLSHPCRRSATCFSLSPAKMYPVRSCSFYLLDLVDQPIARLPELHQHQKSKRHVKNLADSVLAFTGLDWNSFDFFFSCTKTNFGINHVSCFNWSCIEQVTTPGDFQPAAGICLLRLTSCVTSVTIPQPISMNTNRTAL